MELSGRRATALWQNNSVIMPYGMGWLVTLRIFQCEKAAQRRTYACCFGFRHFTVNRGTAAPPHATLVLSLLSRCKRTKSNQIIRMARITAETEMRTVSVFAAAQTARMPRATRSQKSWQAFREPENVIKNGRWLF